MTKLIYIEASPRKERSSSIEEAHVFLEEYRKIHSQDTVTVLDLWHKELPSFDGDIIEAKYAIMHGKSPTPQQKKAWAAIEEIIAEFKSGDKYVFSLPMWNFSIPYKLKHYIDLLVQPTYTFSFSPQEGYKGLVTGKKVVLICARGGAYGPGSGGEGLDMQVNYMKTILGFIGFQQFETILIEPTLDPAKKPEALERAKLLAQKIALSF